MSQEEEKSNILITEANTKTQSSYDFMKREKVREDLLFILSNLSKKGRDKLMNNNYNDEQVFNETEKTMKDLMKRFTLKDTVLFEKNHPIPNSRVPVNSRKTISFLKRQFSKNATQKMMIDKKKSNMVKFRKMKMQKLRALKQGNKLRHRTTHEHQLNLVKQANKNSSIFRRKKPKFFNDLMQIASNSLGVGNGEPLRNTGLLKYG